MYHPIISGYSASLTSREKPSHLYRRLLRKHMDHSAETEREFSAKGTDALGKGVKNWGETEPTHTIRGICNTIRFDDFYPLYLLISNVIRRLLC